MARYGGIDLGGTKIQAVVVDDAHEVLGAARHPTPTTGGPADVALAMVGAIREALATAEVTLDDLTAVGVGSPGAVDEEAGTVTSARNLPDWEGTYALAEKLQSALGAPVAETPAWIHHSLPRTPENVASNVGGVTEPQVTFAASWSCAGIHW